MKIYLDFDGTIVEHAYPSIGKYNVGCFEVIEKLFSFEHEIILNTYQADCHDETLQEAINYLISKNQYRLTFKVLKYKIELILWDWGLHLERNIIFLDDICKGIPIKTTKTSEYEMVDWQKVDREPELNGIYEKNKALRLSFSAFNSFITVSAA